MGNAASLAVSVGVPLVGGFVGSLLSQKDILTWYQKLDKPRWTPPSWLFGPVWTVLYVAQGTASWLVWQKRGKGRDVRVPLGLYAAQLVANLIWNPLFFRSHKTDVATLDAATMLGLATAATVEMSKATSPAVQLPLMVPYLVWVAYATALSANICAKNPTERLIKSKKQRAKEAAGLAGPSLVSEATTAAKDAVKTVSAATKAISAGSGSPPGRRPAAAGRVVLSGRDAAVHASKAVDAATAPIKAVSAGVSSLTSGVASLAGSLVPGSAAAEQAAKEEEEAKASGRLAPKSAAIKHALEKEVAASGGSKPIAASPAGAAEALGLPTEPLTSPEQVAACTPAGTAR